MHFNSSRLSGLMVCPIFSLMSHVGQSCWASTKPKCAHSRWSSTNRGSYFDWNSMWASMHSGHSRNRRPLLAKNSSMACRQHWLHRRGRVWRRPPPNSWSNRTAITHRMRIVRPAIGQTECLAYLLIERCNWRSQSPRIHCTWGICFEWAPAPETSASFDCARFHVIHTKDNFLCNCPRWLLLLLLFFQPRSDSEALPGVQSNW